MTKYIFVLSKVPKKLSNGTETQNKFKPGPQSVLSCAPQDRPRVPQGAKVEAPSMPNDKFGHHESEICLQKCQESTILKQ